MLLICLTFLDAVLEVVLEVVQKVVLGTQKRIFQESRMPFEMVEEDERGELAFAVATLSLHLHRFFTVFTVFSFPLCGISLLAGSDWSQCVIDSIRWPGL